MIDKVTNLQQIPASQTILKTLSDLYKPICGAYHPAKSEVQDHTHVSLTTSYALEHTILQFVQAGDEINDQYACLWELKNRQYDAVLNCLPAMPSSPHEIIQALKENGASAGTPFGRLPTGAQVKPPFLQHPFYFVRMLACLELPNFRFVDLPIDRQHAELIDKVVQHRRNFAEARAAKPALITAGEVKDVLQEFSNNSYSSNASKR